MLYQNIQFSHWFLVGCIMSLNTVMLEQVVPSDTRFCRVRNRTILFLYNMNSFW